MLDGSSSCPPGRNAKRAVGPGPAAELRALVVGDRRPDLGLGIHDERAVLKHGFTDWPALQKQEFSLKFTIDQFHSVRSAQLDGAGRIHCLSAPGGATALAMAAVGVAPSATAGASGASVGTLGGELAPEVEDD